MSAQNLPKDYGVDPDPGDPSMIIIDDRSGDVTENSFE